MSKLIIKTNKKLLPISIALALGTFSTNSYAVEITATADYTLHGATTNVSESIDTSVDPATSVDILDAAGSFWDTGDGVFYHTYGTESNVFGARVSGTGTYDISSTITYVDTVFNDSGTEQAYSFDFTVEAGGISVYGAPEAGQFAYADYDIEVFFGGNLVFSTFSSLELTDSGTAFIGDELLSAYTGGNSYSWSEYLGSADLGILADGETASLEYSMTTKARGNIASTVVSEPVTVCEGWGVIDPATGEEIIECEVVTNYDVGGSTSRSGDPYNIYGRGPGNQFNLASAPTQANSVPEASSLFLMGVGIAGLGFSRRKKFKLS